MLSRETLDDPEDIDSGSSIQVCVFEGLVLLT